MRRYVPPKDLHRVMERSIERAASHTVAVFACPAHPPGAPEPLDSERMEQVGTGLLMGIADERFLVTAAHVADWMTVDERVLALGLRNSQGLPVPIRRTRMIASPIPPGASRREDRVDVAVLPLSETVSSALGKSCKFIHVHDIDLAYEPRPGDQLGVYGFPLADPWSQESPDREIIYKDVLLGTQPLLEPHPKLARMHGSESLFLRYPRTRMFHRLGHLCAPDPNGMSGAGIWLLERRHRAFSRAARNMRLVGFLRDWCRRDGCLLGTRFSTVRDYTLQLRPGLAPALELLRPGTR